MASLVARSAAAASLPSGRAGLLGSGRLALVPALPGHGAPLVLAGRRVGAGHGGVLTVQFVAPARDVKVACANPGTDPDSMGDFSGEDLVKNLEESRSKMFTTPRVYHSPLTDDEAWVREALEDVADQGYALLLQVADCLRPAPKTRLYELLFTVGDRLNFVSRGGAAYSLGLSFFVIRSLDELRRIVSSACGKSLPLTATLVRLENTPLENTVENEMVSLVQHFYETVEYDVRAMLTIE